MFVLHSAGILCTCVRSIPALHWCALTLCVCVFVSTALYFCVFLQVWNQFSTRLLSDRLAEEAEISPLHMETNAHAHVCTRTHTHTQPGWCLIMQVAVNTSGLLVYPEMCCRVFKENNFKREFFFTFLTQWSSIVMVTRRREKSRCIFRILCHLFASTCRGR